MNRSTADYTRDRLSFSVNDMVYGILDEGEGTGCIESEETGDLVAETRENKSPLTAVGDYKVTGCRKGYVSLKVRRRKKE